MEPGTRLGPYEILSPLGAGGMGEVYKARDTRLNRTVAIKVLPAALAADPLVRERFQREARAISQLSHPHICTLFDVGESADYLVMEFVEGQTLAQRLERGALPLGLAVEYGVQIADALSRAHRAGIVHRDLKPANIMLTKSGVKLLDFGLARQQETAPIAGLSEADTQATPATGAGAILGTLHYMSPEQLEGREADARSDLFACGVVLYEMVTGRRPFDGSSQAAVIAAIMRQDPEPIRRTQPQVPAALEHAVAACLAKDADERWQNAADLVRELRWVLAAMAAGGEMALPRRSRERLWMAVAALSLVATVASLAVLAWILRPGPAPVAYRTSVLLPDGLRFPVAGTVAALGRFAISPDGRRLVFAATDEAGNQMLWLRALDGFAAEPLTGTLGAASPFWSPDSRSIAFVAQGQLKRIEVAGGAPMVLADPAVQATGAWNADNVILFTPTARSPLHRVNAAGGPATPVTALDAGAGEVTHRSPFFLPGGERFLYVAVTARNGAGEGRAVYAGSLAGGTPTLILEQGSNAKYAAGHLLFLRERTLMAQPFDAGSLELSGQAGAVAEDLELIGPGMGAFSVSDQGVLAYQTAATQGSQLAWFDRGGRPLGTLGDPANYGDVELSPDGRQAAVSVLDASTNTRDIWLFDVARGVRTRFTSHPADDVAPIWSADGSRVLFTSARGGHFDLYTKPSGGVGGETLVFADERDKYPTSWSPDGASILYWTFDASGTNLWLLPAGGGEDARPRPFMHAGLSPGRFSPDGRWVAYYSSESGRSEVYVVPFPDASRRWQVSSAGGNFSRWSADGREIFYAAQNRLMRVPVTASGGELQAGTPQVLFFARPVGPRYFYDVSPDGQRLLVNTAREESASTSITLVQNWAGALER